MSAPLVVNTTDGTCWTRRDAERDGQPLYAPEKCGQCPPFVMATYGELDEHGIAGFADVLPMPAGPEPQESPVDADRAKAPWGRGEDGRPLLPMGAHWTDIPELVDRTLAGIQSRVDQAQSGHWYVASATETWRAPGTVCTRVDGYPATVGLFTNVLPGDLELVLHAHSDLRWCLDLIGKLRAEVAELLVERHVTNEALDDAVQELKARSEDARPTHIGRGQAARFCLACQALASQTARPLVVCPGDDRPQHRRPGACSECGMAPEEWCQGCAKCACVNEHDAGCPEDVTPQVTKLRALLAGQRAAVEDPHDSPLYHRYRVGHDLPETGGAR